MATFGSLFAGIGGIDLGLERAGWECRFQVEWDPFCQRVLAKHWPDVPRFGDIHEVHGVGACVLADASGPERRAITEGRIHVANGDDPRWEEASGRSQLGGPSRSCPNCLPSVDLLAGGFPCQPFSVAGRQRRLDDDRWLWPEFARAIRELRPRYVLVENVPGLLVGGGMDAVLGDLAELGYDAEWESIPAAAVGAPHLRYRVWIIGTRRAELGRLLADSGGLGFDEPAGALPAGRDAVGNGGGPLADTDGSGPQGRPIQPERAGERPAGAGGVGDAYGTPTDAYPEASRSWGATSEPGWWSVEPDVGRVAHGVPARVDRLRSLGNAVVPQVVEVIGRQLLASLERVA